MAFDLTAAEGTGLAVRVLGGKEGKTSITLLSPVSLLTSNELQQSDGGWEGWREASSGMGGGEADAGRGLGWGWPALNPGGTRRPGPSPAALLLRS